MRTYNNCIPLLLLLLTGSLLAQSTVNFTHDQLNRIQLIEYPNGATITYTYDAVGNRLTQTISTNPLAPQANFSVNPTSGPVPLQVTFTDASVPGSNPITSWQWDFNNDGTYDANGEGPHIFTYTSVGIYSVKLRVSDGILFSEHLKQNYITVTTATNQPPIVQNIIPDQNLETGGPNFERDLELPPVVFFDPDGDILEYTVSSSNELVATATISQSLSKINLGPLSNKVIGSDVTSSSSKVDKLIYNNAEIDGGLNGSLLTVSPLSEGAAIITVTADDGHGGIISTTFDVTVSITPTIEGWAKQLTLEDAGGMEMGANLIFGQKPNATNGIDTAFGESELPPLPPAGAFDARFILPTVPEVGSLIDIRDTSLVQITWTITFQPSTAGYPMTFSWDTLSFPFGTFYLTDRINGTFINVNMRNQASYTLTNPVFTSLNIKYSRLATAQLSVSLENGWNMVSIPGLHPTDQNVNTWWQYRDMSTNVYKFNGGYQSVPTVEPAIGYWMKHLGARIYNTGDEWPASGIQIVAHNPLIGLSGWNMIGGYELIIAAAGVTTNPPGLQSGQIYKYSGGYQVATTLDPGYGYWIKLTGAGQIIIPETLAKDGKSEEYFPENWGRIVITDNAGHSYKLYAVSDKSNIDLSAYELPPAPPVGMFDIRYESGRIAEDINSSIKAIDMSGVTYPLTVRVEGMDIRLMDETGVGVNVNLKSGENIVISDATIQKLMVGGELLPTVYSLEQNYPNPFNPSTVIEFSLPEDVSNVKLSIYNTLGEKVAELVNTSLQAGRYQYTWNAQDVATGIYIYELRTDKFVSVKKMILLK